MTNKAGQTLKVGLEGFKGNTPPILKVIYRSLMALISVWAIVQPAFPEIPQAAVHLVDKICMLGLPLFYAVSQSFGYTKD